MLKKKIISNITQFPSARGRYFYHLSRNEGKHLFITIYKELVGTSA